ncbi:hypothetical protein L596_003848 [Steinernema carpocapsae]|uniref:G-protein coupled receptors family 1 profile domain-containing protein n=1 Tax=Steinernema carpocapsae TaxID=34508 RepID=A0A4U8UVI9_STECR|nr:hypothetical protein L596_003848 [Steinernema carpocapsae]
MTENETVVEQLTLFERNFYLVNGFVGTILNGIVLFIALRHVDTYDKPRQIIVINMTLADLLMCLVYMPTRPFLNVFAEYLCFSYYIIICTCQLCSCLNLLWLNVDKLVFIQFPLHYYTIISRARILFITILTWVVLLAISAGVYSTMKIINACNLVSIKPLIYLPICILYVIMIIASFAISSVIYFIAKNSRKFEPRARLKMFQRLFFLFSSTLWTFVTCLPYRLLYLLHALCESCRESNVLLILTDFFFKILVVGIVINPIITIVTQRLYRHQLVIYGKKIFNLFAPRRDSFDSFTNCTATSTGYTHRISKLSTVAEPASHELEQLKENTQV